MMTVHEERLQRQSLCRFIDWPTNIAAADIHNYVNLWPLSGAHNDKHDNDDDDDDDNDNIVQSSAT